jgi:hypothetical protein
MSLIPVGAAANKLVITEMAEKLNVILGDRIKNAEIHLKTDDELRRRAGGMRATGFWNLHGQFKRQIWLLDDLSDYPVGKTLAHEALHVLDDDWLTKNQRTAIRELMTPKPRSWKDAVVNDDPKGYAGLPFESFAVYGSVAVGDLGFNRPAYLRIFKRTIADTDALGEILLRDTDSGTRGADGRDEDDDFENVPSGPDTVDELQDQLEDSQKKVDDIQKRLNFAKFKAAKIGVALTDGDLDLAREKANEIQAL